jgi:hypothetical protein
MKKLVLFLSLMSTSLIYAQSLPINFEGDVTTADFVDFDGGVAEVTTNPLTDEVNASSGVARIIRDGGAIWGGSKIVLAENLDFSELTKLTMKVYTTAPVGTIVKFKLESEGNSAEVNALTTVSGQWETLEWIFAGTPSTMNELVFMFDFGSTGDGTENSTFYFDDIEQVVGPPAPDPTVLPLDFESGILSSDFLDFAGAISTVIPNPQMNADNNSANVCQIVRNGGEIYAGSRILLAENLDLSSMWHISMKVFTDAPIGTRIKLQLEGDEIETSLDYLTTETGVWETIDYNFDNQVGDFNKITFMFDFGNLGDGSETSTFLFDDVAQMMGPALPAPIPAEMPIDFENSVVSTDFTNTFGGIATVIPNPQMDSNNPSATVGHFIRSGGQGYARSKIILTENLNLSSMSAFTMKVYTEAPVGTLLKFKLESTTSGAANERDAYTTVSGEWATYTWDFAGDPPVYDAITLMLGYGAPSDASPSATFLFDDITQAFPPPPIPTASLPIDFEGDVNDSYFTDFGGAATTVIENPQANGMNTSNTVGQIIRSAGQTWAGSKLLLDDILDFSSLGYISMKVYTEAPAGTLMKLKLEGDNGAETEVNVETTASGEWETLIWDFTNAPADFNSLVFMFDFGSLGDSTANSTFLFDDIQQTNENGTTGIQDIGGIAEINCYPNPAKDRLTISSENQEITTVFLFDILGNQVLALSPNSPLVNIDVTDFATGVYIARISTATEVGSMKLIIE